MARPTLIEDVVTRAIRAFDLIIRAGGFSLVALDLSDVPGRYVRALPWATWKRLAVSAKSRGSKMVADDLEDDLEPAEMLEKTGATRRTRTGDLLITNQLLYQLSYVGVRCRDKVGAKRARL